LVAQIFGGGHPSDQQYAGKPNIGQENVEAARKVLSRRGIKVVSEDVGGHLGRKIAFEIETGNVAVLRVQDIRESDWHFSDEWRGE
jgi:chemotaxis protein CheD